MNNYPPGTSRRDLVRGGIIEPHDHEHRFDPEDASRPTIEDGAAIFQQPCRYVEGEYGEGWSCEETRTYRFEYSTLEAPNGTEYDLPTIHEWDDHDLPILIAEMVVQIEQQHNNGDNVSVDVDPDPDRGQVTLTYRAWRLHFRP